MTLSSVQPIVPRRAGGRIWRTSVGISAVVGMAAAAVAPETGGLPSLVVLLFVLGAVVGFMLRSMGVPRAGVLTWATRFGLLGAPAIGLLAAFDLLGVTWVACLIVTSSPVRGRLHFLCTRGDLLAPGVAPPDDLIVDDPVRDDARQTACEDVRHADLDAVCRAWRRSYVILQRAEAVPCILAVVQQRQRLLDEMARRNPEGMSRWLASNPRAAGNPLPFLMESATGDGAAEVQ